MGRKKKIIPIPEEEPRPRKPYKEDIWVKCRCGENCKMYRNYADMYCPNCGNTVINPEFQINPYSL